MRTVFRFAVRRPALLGLVREVNRLGPEVGGPPGRSGSRPLVERAIGVPGRRDGRRHDPPQPTPGCSCCSSTPRWSGWPPRSRRSGWSASGRRRPSSAACAASSSPSSAPPSAPDPTTSDAVLTHSCQAAEARGERVAVRRACRRWSRPPAGRYRRRRRWCSAGPGRCAASSSRSASSCGERDAARPPEVPRHRARDRVDLVHPDVVAVPQEVDAGHAPDQRQPARPAARGPGGARRRRRGARPAAPAGADDSPSPPPRYFSA